MVAVGVVVGRLVWSKDGEVAPFLATVGGSVSGGGDDSIFGTESVGSSVEVVVLSALGDGVVGACAEGDVALGDALFSVLSGV